MNANQGFGPSHGQPPGQPGPQAAQDDEKKKLILLGGIGVLAVVSMCCISGILVAVFASSSSDPEPVLVADPTSPQRPTAQPNVPQPATQGVDAQGHATPASFGVQMPHTVDQLARNVVGVSARMIDASLERGLVEAATRHFSRSGSRRYFAAVILSTDWRISRSRVGIIRNRNLDVMLFWQDEGGVCRAAPYAFKQDSDGRGFQTTFRYADGRSYEVAHPVPERGERPSNPQKTRRRNDYRLSSRQPAIYSECSAPGAIARYEAERARKIEERRARRDRRRR